MPAPTLKRLPLTAATVTPPSIDRNSFFHDHHNRRVDKNKRSYSASSSASSLSSSSASSIAPAQTAVLADVARRTASPCRKSSPVSSSQALTPTPPPENRTSWEDCRQQRDGYVSFPDFDQECAARSEQAEVSK